MKNNVLLIFLCFISETLFAQLFISDANEVALVNEAHLSVTGNFINNGKIHGTGFLQFTGSNSQNISGDGILERLRVDKSSGQAEITEGNQDVFRIFEMHGGNFAPNSRLTLKSNDTLTAQIGMSTGGTISGDMIIERFIPKSNRAYRYFSSPVATPKSILDNLQEGQNNQGTNYPADNLDTLPGYGTHITGSTSGANGFDATLTGNHSFYSWDSPLQSWSTIENTNVKTLEKGESFALMVRGSRGTNLNSNSAVGPATTLRLTGNPAVHNFKKEHTLEGENSFLLVGNPYHSTIDANQFFQHNSGLNSNFIYVFDPTLNTRGGYATVELPSGTNQQGSEANQFIQPWQAIFVEAENTEALTLNVSFAEADKDVQEPQVGTFNTTTRINVKLENQTKTIDAVSLKLEHGANSEVDKNDAKKFWNLDENLSIFSQGNYLSIEERDFPKQMDTVMLHLYQKRKENYRLKLNALHLSETQIIFKDFYLDEAYALTSGQDLIVDYPVVEGEPEFRFGFIIGSETLSTTEFSSKNFRIYPNPARDVLNIEALNSTHQKLEFEIYSLLGQRVANGDFKNQDKISNLDISSLSEGVYLIVITGNENSKDTLKFIKI